MSRDLINLYIFVSFACVVVWAAWTGGSFVVSHLHWYAPGDEPALVKARVDALIAPVCAPARAVAPAPAAESAPVAAVPTKQPSMAFADLPSGRAIRHAAPVSVNPSHGLIPIDPSRFQ